MTTARRLIEALILGVVILISLSCGRDIGPTESSQHRKPEQYEIVAGDAQSGPVGQQLTSPLVVRVTDASGRAVQGQEIKFRVTAGAGSLLLGTAITNDSGVVRERWTLGTNVADSQRVEVRGEGTNGDVSVVGVFRATAVAGPAARIAKVAGDSQIVVAGAPAADSLTVRVSDAFGNVIAGASVTWSVSLGGGSVSASVTNTSPLGVAKVVHTLGKSAGSNSVAATAAGIGNPVSFAAQGIAGPPSILTKLAGDGQTGTAGTQTGVAPAVTVTDVNGNPVAGVTVTFAVGTGGGSVTSAMRTSNADGVAAIGGWILGGFAGANTLTASVAGLSPLTFAATGVAGAASQIVLNAGNGQVAIAGDPVTVAPSVKVNDANGNAVAGVTVTFAVATGGGSVTGSAPATNTSGVATVGSWLLGSTAGANTLTAAATGLTGSPVTFTATGTALTLASVNTTLRIGVRNTRVQSFVPGVGNIDDTLAVKLTDASGAPVVGRTMTWTTAGGRGSSSSVSAVTDVNGIARSFWTAGSVVGTDSLTASASGISSPVTFTVRVSNYHFTQVFDGLPATRGVAWRFKEHLQTQIIDNNTGLSVRSMDFFVITAPGCSFVSAFGNEALSCSSTGSVSVAFQQEGLNGVDNPGFRPAITLTVANPKLAVATAPSAAPQAGIPFVVQPVIQVQDATGAVLTASGLAVTASITSGGGTLGGTATATATASGQATFTDLSIAGLIGTRTLAFSATGHTSASAAVTLGAGTATTVVMNGGDGQTALPGSAVTTAPSVKVTDAFGNAVAGVTVTFAAATGGGSATGATTVTNTSGVATVGSWILGATAGVNTLTATVVGLTGSPITFTATGSVLAGLSLAFSQSDLTIGTMRGDGTNRAVRAPGVNPTWRANTILARGGSGDNTIYAMDSLGLGRHQILGAGPSYSPDLSADGAKFALFYGDCSGPNHPLATVNVEGTGRTMLGICALIPPRWSPLGDRIAYVGPDSNLYSAKTDGTDIVPVTASRDVSWIGWSPDATQFVINKLAGGIWRLYLVNADGSNLRPLISPAGVNDENPDWSPVGDWILFRSNRSGKSELWVVRVDGTGLQQVTNTALDQWEGRWRR